MVKIEFEKANGSNLKRKKRRRVASFARKKKNPTMKMNQMFGGVERVKKIIFLYVKK